MHKNPQGYIYIDIIPTCFNRHAIIIIIRRYEVYIGRYLHFLMFGTCNPEDDGMSIETYRDKVNVNITLWIFVGLF
jgi:hypothetical protein